MQETVKKIREALEGLGPGASKASALEAAAKECGMAAIAIDLVAAQSFLSGDMVDLGERVSAAGADAGAVCADVLASVLEYGRADGRAADMAWARLIDDHGIACPDDQGE